MSNLPKRISFQLREAVQQAGHGVKAALDDLHKKEFSIHRVSLPLVTVPQPL